MAQLESLRPATAPGEDRNHLTVGQFRRSQGLLRPATAPGEDRNRQQQPGGKPDRALRPATAPGEDRNRARAVVSCGLRSCLRPATAPGEDRNRPAGGLIGGLTLTCARPPRRARIATRTATSVMVIPQILRPATAPGEDCNGNDWATADVTGWLRPATAPGEDRNPSE